jgi:hypothetical protein
MADPDEPAPSANGEPRGAELWLAPFFRDSSLWPVLCVAVAIFVVLGASALLLAFVERNPFAVAALLLLLWISVDAVIRDRRRGRSRLLLGCVTGFWLLSIAAAAGARWAGWF